MGGGRGADPSAHHDLAGVVEWVMGGEVKCTKVHITVFTL